MLLVDSYTEIKFWRAVEGPGNRVCIELLDAVVKQIRLHSKK